MKLKQILIGLAFCGALANPSQAALYSSQQDWQFSTWLSPAAPEVVDNPFGSPTANITVNPVNWSYSDSGYGQRTGFWDLTGGGVLLTIPNVAGSGPGDYAHMTLRIVQFLGGPFLGDLGYSLAGGVNGGRTTVETVGSNRWVEDTWTWDLTSSPDPVVLNITSPALGSLVDRIRFDVNGFVGDVVIPEPAVTQSLAAGGLILYVLCSQVPAIRRRFGASLNRWRQRGSR